MTEAKTFAVIGAGIGGLTTAIALQRIGIRTRIYESATGFRQVGAGIVLAPNAIKAFTSLGVADDLIEKGHLLQNFSICDQSGAPLTTTPNESAKKFPPSYAFHRAELHASLISKLNSPVITLGMTCVDFFPEGNGITLVFKDGSRDKVDGVIAADGIHSVFRKKLLPKSSLRYSGYTCWRGVTEDSIVSDREAKELWGRGRRFGYVPLSDGRVYWYATVNAKPKDASLRDNADAVSSLFLDFPELVSLAIKKTAENRMIRNDIYDFPPVSKYAFGNVLLLGDAAHATTPNMGQGACMAIEDAAVLMNCLSKSSDISDAFNTFSAKRLKRTRKIVETSYSLGRISQVENRTFIAIRNKLMRLTPSSVSEKQFRFLYEVSFD